MQSVAQVPHNHYLKDEYAMSKKAFTNFRSIISSSYASKLEVFTLINFTKCKSFSLIIVLNYFFTFLECKEMSWSPVINIVIMQTLLLCIGIANANASSLFWNDKTATHFEIFETEVVEPYLKSIWSTCRSSNKNVAKKEDGELSYKKLTIPSSYFEDGNIEVMFKFSPSSANKKLAIFIPGIFSEYRGKQSQNMTRRLYQQGYDVLHFANPLAIEFLKLKPKFKTGNVVSEAKSIYQGIRDIWKANNFHYEKVEVLGVSYGTLITSIISYFDSIEEKPILNNGYFTLLSPPIDLYHSAKTLDRLIETMLSHYTGMPPYWKFALKLLSICGADDLSELPDLTPERAQDIVTYLGFYHPLIEGLNQQYENHGDPNHHGRRLGMASPTYRRWVRSVRFANNINPDAIVDSWPPDLNLAQHKNAGQVLYWANLAENNKRVRVVTCDNDFINQTISWPETKPGQLVVLNGCSHYGMRADNWYLEFLKLAF
jgi:hypothetical protein